MRHRWQNLRTNFLLSVLFLVIVTVSGSAFLVFSLRLGDDWLAREISRTYLSIIDQKGRFIQEEALRIQSLLESAMHRDEVLDILSKSLSPYEKSRLIIDFREDIVSAASYNDVTDIYFYRDDSLHFYLRDIIFRFQPDFAASRWYRRTVQTTADDVNWFGLLPSQFNETTYQLYLSKPVVNMKRGELERLGLAFMTVDRRVFDRILADLSESGTTCLVDDADQIIYCSDPEGTESFLTRAALRREAAGAKYVVAGTGSRRYITVVGPENDLGWRIIHRAPFDAYPPEVQFTRRLLGSLFVLSLLTFGLFLVVYRLRIGVPLRRLAQSVFSYQSGFTEVGDPRTGVPVDPRILQEQVREIVENTKSSVARLRHSERERQIAEVRKLQAQMNPHFLYKILNNIRFIAMLNDQTQIVEITEELFSLVVASLTEADVVTLSQESAMLEAYAKLIRSVYDDRISVEISIQDAALDCYVPKLLLQPIVENALYHGIDPNVPGGLIRVRGWVEGDSLILSVADNGRGVGESPLGSATESDGSHIGLVGTDTRLRVFFGDDYTIRLSTSDLGGAEVVLSFRAEKTPLTAPAG